MSGDGLVGLQGIQALADAIGVELPRVMSRAATDAADNISDLIDAQFDAGVGPWGNPWAPLAESTKRKGRQDPPLDDEGVLRSPVVEALQGAGIRISYDEDYAEFHQNGTSRMPQRMLVPPEGTISPAWNAAIVEAYNDAFNGMGGWRAAGAQVTEDLAQAAEE